jgi:hypothetical protein
MYNFLKKQRKLFLGILIGLIIGTGSFVFADTLSRVSAVVTDYVLFKFDGEAKKLPEGYTVLNYQGRNYVPARFVAENLGAEVKWDDAKKIVDIKSNKEKCPEPPVQEEPADKDDSKDKDKNGKDTKKYNKLPVSAVKKDVWVCVSGINVDEDDKYTWVYVEVENKGEDDIQLDQRATKIIKNGETYHQTDVRAVYDYDKKWYDDILEDEKVSGFVKMPMPANRAETWGDIKLVLRVFKNDGSGEDIEFTFDIAHE